VNGVIRIAPGGSASAVSSSGALVWLCQHWSGSERLRNFCQEQHTTVEPGLRWIKHPAAISPVWLEKPERIAALAMLTVVGVLVDSILQRQVRLSLRTHDQQLPGNNGPTATPTAAVVLTLFVQVALVQLWIGDQVVVQV
jgi:hypothetical protein